MDDRRIGLSIRALRRRLGWRQEDLAAAAGVSQSIVSRIERGHLEHVSLPALRLIIAALDARLVLDVQWRGGMLDRLLDERHAHLVERVAYILRNAGWEVRVEVSFALFGERGSIDFLAWHAATRSLVAIEVKSELTALEVTLRQLSVRNRVAITVARAQFGWDSASLSCLLVLPESSTARRRFAEHSSTFASMLPTPGSAVRGWLRRPHGRIGAAWFLSDRRLATGRRKPLTPHRIRVRRPAPKAVIPHSTAIGQS